MDAVTQPWPVNRADALALGRAIFDPLAPAQKVERAARVLVVATERVAAPAEVLALLDRVRDPSRWSECHDAFRAVRALTLAEERSPTHRAYYTLLLLAENVAKTAYNASGGAQPPSITTRRGGWPSARARSSKPRATLRSNEACGTRSAGKCPAEGRRWGPLSSAFHAPTDVC